jgi:hypothetical protein
MCRDADEKVVAECLSNHGGLERGSSQMNAVRASCARHVRAVIDQQSRFALGSDFGGASGQLLKRSRGQLFFAELNQINP